MSDRMTAAEYNKLWQGEIDKEPKKYHNVESEEQRALFKWRDTQLHKYPVLRLMFAIPNGGNRDAITGAMMKAEGTTAGIPDIFLAAIRGGCGGMFIEMKSGKNKPTALQQKWLDDLEAEGYITKCCHGWQEAVEEIIFYLEGPR